MTKTKVLLVLAFVVTLAAGVAAGLLASRLAHRPRGPSWLADELNLTSQQREQMHTIWSDVMRTQGRSQWEQRKALAQERDDAIAALMTDNLRPQYEKILEEYSRKVDELGQERTRAFEQAVEQTRKILTPEQAEKYDALLTKQREQGPGESPGLRPPWGERRRPRPGPEEGTPENETTPRGGE